MDDIVLARTLRAQGYNSDEVRRLKERGELSGSVGASTSGTARLT